MWRPLILIAVFETDSNSECGYGKRGAITMKSNILTTLLAGTLLLQTDSKPPQRQPFTLEAMVSLYKQISVDKGKEFVVCVYGRQNAETFYKPKVFSTDTENVEYEPCTVTPDYLGTYHSHLTHLPYYLCEPSDTDYQDAKESNDKIIGLVCGDTQGKVFTKTWNLKRNTK